jgi:hypothetical protein
MILFLIMTLHILVVFLVGFLLVVFVFFLLFFLASHPSSHVPVCAWPRKDNLQLEDVLPDAGHFPTVHLRPACLPSSCHVCMPVNRKKSKVPVLN